MAKIFVVWKSYHKPEIIERGYWDQGLLEDMFKQLEVQHVTDVDEVPEGEGAVFVINGRTHIEDTDQINADIAKLPWVLFIETGDEEALFPWREIKHPLMKVWLMLPRMNQHDDVHFKLPNGYRPETRELLKNIGLQKRDIPYSFAGQVNHERREQCFDVARQFQPIYENSVVIGTKTFGEHALSYPDYLNVMARSKIVLCPSGIESPDNFRLYEALEAGCIPVVDAFSTQNKAPGFWRYLFGHDIPFPIVSYWDKLPDMIPGLLADYPHNANRIYGWWQNIKRSMQFKLIDDIKELSK